MIAPALLACAVALFAAGLAIAVAREPATDPDTQWIYAHRRPLAAVCTGAGLAVAALALTFTLIS